MRPQINVTPLIDILLVLLIIFMVVSPLKPTAFNAKVPAGSRTDGVADPHTLVVALARNGVVTLNNERESSAPDDLGPLVERLKGVFAARLADAAAAPDSTGRTVFIKAGKTASYGDVAKVIDAVKTAGAAPVALQIDDLTD